MNEVRLEELTTSISLSLYAEAVGLPYDTATLQAAAAELETEYHGALHSDAWRDLALDGLADSGTTGWYPRLLDVRDATLMFPQVRRWGRARHLAKLGRG